ncbi:MAG: TonB-dependent receptor [Bacteroidetes bacterium]|nr:TonB-dependent receptor [Bacteroidota bacterium]MDA1121062.1 TonB-dependent receptor [Bacteroidota bacterium]
MKILPLILLFCCSQLSAQNQRIVFGIVTNENSEPIENVNVIVSGTSFGAITNASGRYELTLPILGFDSLLLEFRHVQYQAMTQLLNEVEDARDELNMNLILATTFLDPVEIRDLRNDAVRIEAGNINIDPKSAENLTSAFGDFSKVLATLPGVVSNNELSSSYSVRGGNFDENLVYVNDILIYRPFLVRAGQQEGLSFINPDLVGGISFSSGGWQPKYGDKLSSSLNIKYKEPKDFGGSSTLSSLGGRIHLEGTSKSKLVSSVLGVRHKNSRYLLNTLDVNGQYLPKFTDIQSYSTFRFKPKANLSTSSTSVNLLLAYSKNRYLIEPEARETDFGTFSRSFRLFVAFDGREISQYDTYQGAVKLNHRFNNRVSTSLITSIISTKERELFEVEGGYRLCDLNTNLGSDNFNECAFTRGIGTDFNFGRNTLDARIINIDSRSTAYLSSSNKMEFGVGYSNENIDDQLNEYNFTDSANYTRIGDRIENEIHLNSNRLTAYVQNTSVIQDSVHFITYGLRINYWDLNGDVEYSPRLQYAFQPASLKNTVFRAAFGRFVQPPFYRELRNRQGIVTTDLKAQVSWYYIAGVDHLFTMWGREFKLFTEAYYKKINRIIAYDVDNIRLRYFGDNDTQGYATGLDFRINGEFVPGAESWFSLGFLKTEENILGDGSGYIRRPSDQRVNVGVFFQDHLPQDPTIRVSLNFLYGSGLPFGPPGDDRFRNSFNGDEYLRADIGFSKIFLLEKNKHLESISLGLDILNLFGINNTISYTWVTDLSNNQFGVPNNLSARFFNARLTVNF